MAPQEVINLGSTDFIKKVNRLSPKEREVLTYLEDLILPILQTDENIFSQTSRIAFLLVKNLDVK